MPKPRLKGQSRRMTTKKASKISKKIREHKRKMKKLHKHNPKKVSVQSKIKKEASLPNIMPFKEKILKEAEEHVLGRESTKDRNFRLLDEREREKEQNKQILRNLTRKEKFELMMQRAMTPNGLSAREVEMPPLAERVERLLSKDNQTPKQTTKVFYKDFKEVVKQSDIILEVLDARDPLGSRCAELENYIIDAGPSKRLVLLLNKVDLIPRQNLLDWLKYLRNEYPTLPFKASTQIQRTNLKQQKGKITKLPENAMKIRGCLGSEKLLQLFGNYCRNKDIKSSITIGVVGFPNTGKSSVINSLKRSRSCTVGAIPGITRSVQKVYLDRHTWLLDSPGLVMTRDMTSVGAILHNCVNINNIDDPIPPVETILKRCNKEQMMKRYLIPDYTDGRHFLQLVANRYGYIVQGGVPDITRAGKHILQEWNVGRIRYYTHPPSRPVDGTNEKAELLQELSQPFDIDALYKDEEKQFMDKGTSKTKRKGKAMLVDDIPISNDELSKMEEQLPVDTLGDETCGVGLSEPLSKDIGDDDMHVDTEAVTVVLAENKKTADAHVEQPDPDLVLNANIRFNRLRKKDYCKMKKERKRQDAVAACLSEALNAALPSASASL